MKYILSFLFFFHSFSYSQTDSIGYYSQLTDKNIKLNNFKEAILHTQKAINYSKTKHKITALANQTFILGKIYYTQEYYKTAITVFSKSISLHKSLPQSTTLATAHYYLGMANIEEENYIEAKKHFAISDAINEKLKIYNETQSLALQKGIAYKRKGKYDFATVTFKTITEKKEQQVSSKTKAEAFFQLATIENQLKRSKLAIDYLQSALELNAKDNDLKQKSKIVYAFSKSYKILKDYNSAYHYLDEYYTLKDQISKMSSARLNQNDITKFKENRQINAAIQREKAIKEQEKAYKNSKLISILAITLIIILSLLSFSLFKNNIIRKESNLLLREKNNELIFAKNKAEKASEARSEFLSTVSHELRTPLNAINGITHLLLEEDPKESQKKYLSSLKFSGDYLSTFINKILEINKIESTKIEIENIGFNLKELVVNIKNSLKGLVNNNSFEIELDPKIPDSLIGDPTKISQILLNLINNALKFTQNGSVRVLTQVTYLQDGITTIYFEVADTGIGIAEDKLESIFDSFSQGSIEINRKYGGTGLGLTIVKKLIHLLGGNITLESSLKKGSRFSFILSFAIDSHPLLIKEKLPLYDVEKLRTRKVLLVEDNKINQMITTKMLQNKEMYCEIIDNGEDAIERARNNYYDLILMDVHLPGINGTLATKRIREFNKTTPIIALTAISLDENREMLLSFGMNDVITKPFVPNKFYSVIANHLVSSNNS